jgi:HK97 family phage portal protein
MAFWKSMLGVVTGAGFRQTGLQAGTPGVYSKDAAASVTLDTAMQLSAVFASVRLISETVASLPLNVYRKPTSGTKREIADQHPLQILFAGKPNRWQTRQEYFETLMYQKVSLGNSYSAIQRNGRDEIIGLVPLMSPQMEVKLEKSGAMQYRYTNGQDVNVYSSKSIWHNKLFGNGVIGLSPLGYARNSIGIGIAAEESVTSIYANGGKPSGILTIDKILTSEQRAAIRENFKELAEGENNRLFTLEAGMDYKTVSLSPQDIELLSSRRFQIEDIARFFGVPSALINDTSSTTAWGSGIQQIVEGFYKLTLRPYLSRMEASMMNNLLTNTERAKYEIEFDFNELVQPFLAERIKSYKEAITGAIMTPNQCRKEEGWPDIEGGDQLYMQQQMTPLSVLVSPDFKRSNSNAKTGNN